VCSQTFDHTSVIQFIEKRFGVTEPHITPWRRTVSGDLTSALNFTRADTARSPLPDTADFVSFVSGSKLVPLTQAEIVAGQQPVATLKLSVPADQTMPVQEPGQRLARALPYQLQADAQPKVADRTLSITFRNTGTAGVFFHVRTALSASNSGQGTGPWGYTVDPVSRSLSDTWAPTSGTDYDLSVFGPNGFFRRYAGGLTTSSANLSVETVYDSFRGGITVTVTNAGDSATTVNLVDKYTGRTERGYLARGERFLAELDLKASSRWYDVLITADSDPGFVRHYAGHVETGADSVSDPLIGRNLA
jgi:phospholipase C